jgi:hypothetical protein
MCGRLLGIAGVLVVAAALAGCLDFDEQVAYGEHDQDGDRVVVVIGYMGLFGNDQAQAQLKEAVEDQTVALFGNWPLAFPIKKLRAGLKEPPKPDEALPEPMRQKLLALLERIRVLNGGFFTDLGGRVCGGQVVVVDKASDTVRLANELANEFAILKLQAKDPRDSWEEAVLEAAQAGHKWLELRGQSVIVSWPMPEDRLREGRREFVRGFIEQQFADEGLRVRGLLDMFASQFFVWHEGGVLKVKWGLEGQPSFFVLKPRQGKYLPDLVEHVRQTYGLHLDDLLARYLADPKAAAQTEAEQAAQIIAPRLPKTEVVRVLVRAIRANPTDALWARLRPVPFEPGMPAPEAATDEALLACWEQWLGQMAPAPERPQEAPQD